LTAWEAVLLGIVQGATEFLPISSSGHLVLGQALLNLHPPGILLEVVLHAATMLAVIVYFRKRLGWMLLNARRKEGDGGQARRYILWLLIGTVPAGLAGVFLTGPIGGLFDSPSVALYGLLATGIILFSSRWSRERGVRPDGRSAIIVGVAQALAIIPGVSRSGATIAAGMLSGVKRRAAAEFSFLLSVPAIGGASLLHMIELLREGLPGGDGLGMGLAVGFAAAFLSGYAAIAGLLEVLRRKGLAPFAWYCWAVGLAGLLFLV
jgi:undecaprenyl-diphosphatase